MEPLFSADEASARAIRQQLAAQNVKRVVATFLFFDIFCIASFGYQVFAGGLPNAEPFFDSPQMVRINKALAFKVLPVVLQVSFTVDVVLAVILLWKLDSNDPHWEEHKCLVRCTWYSNLVTLIFLTAQRFAVVLSQNQKWILCGAFVYVGIRSLKLRPLYMLDMMVKSVVDAKGKNTKYEAIWMYWSHQRNTSWEKRLLRCSCMFAVFAFVAVFILGVYLNATSAPMGLPPPRPIGKSTLGLSMVHLGPSASMAKQAAPIMLDDEDENCICCSSRCRDKNYWYVCGGSTCKDRVVVYNAFDPVKLIAVDSSSAAAAATGLAGIAALFMPELVPFGAVLGGGIGALTGSVAVVYDVESNFWCEESSEIPKTARDELYCG